MRAAVLEGRAVLVVTGGKLAQQRSLAIQQGQQTVPVMATVPEMMEQKDL